MTTSIKLESREAVFLAGLVVQYPQEATREDLKRFCSNISYNPKQHPWEYHPSIFDNSPNLQVIHCASYLQKHRLIEIGRKPTGYVSHI